MLLSGCGKTAGLSCRCPDRDADFAHVTGARADSQKWLSHGGPALQGRADGEKWLCHVEWAWKEKGGRQDTENIDITNYLNKLDKNTLNLYTAPRAYG